MKGSGLGQYEEIKSQLAGETDEHHVSAAGKLTSGPGLKQGAIEYKTGLITTRLGLSVYFTGRKFV